MELHQLRYVTYAARYGSIAKASSELYISRQAMSKAIRSFEQELGFEIFERGTKLRPTPAGKEVIKHADKVLKELNEIDMLADSKPYEPSQSSAISIALTSFPLDFLFFNPEHEVMVLLDDFAQKTSGSILSIYHLSDAAILNALDEGSIDIGFVHGNYEREGIKLFPVSKMEMRLITLHNHPLSKKNSIKISDLKDVPIRSPLDFDFFTTSFIERCHEYGFEPKYHVVPLNDESIYNFCNEGGVHIQPYDPSMETKYPEQAYIPFHPNDRKDLPLCFAYNEAIEKPSAVKLINYFKAHAHRR